MKSWNFAAGVLTVLAFMLCPAAKAAPATHPGIGGIYVVAPANRQVGKDKGVDIALINSSVDGAYISLNWNTIEPAQGQFNWAEMDAELAAVAADHKKASLAVIPGQYTPDWVYQAGAKSFNTVVEPLFASDFCSPLRLPIPWDPVYLNAWTKFVQAFGARYANNPAVSMIKITGVSYRTDETSLPFGALAHLPANRTVKSLRTGKACVLPDDLKQWQTDGYTWAKVDDAFEKIVIAYKSAFPGLPMGIMTSDHAFPPLSKDGLANDPAGFALATTDFFNIGKQQLGTNFIAQFNGLTAKQVNAGVAAFANSNPTAYQTGMPTHDEPFCIMNARQKPCDELQVFQGAMNEALGAKTRYLEIFFNDANNPPFQDILKQVHEKLSTGAAP